LYFVGYFLSTLLLQFPLPQYISLSPYLISVALELYIIYYYGRGDFSKYKTMGPFDVGHKKINSSKFGGAVSIFYPIDKDPNNAHPHSQWLPHGKKSLEGLGNSGRRYEEASGIKRPYYFVKSLLSVKMISFENPSISPVFTKESKPLIPILFSHGNGSNRTMNSCFLSEFASYGYLVISPDHTDGTCSHTVTARGENLFYDKWQELYDLPLKKQHLSHREKETISLIDEISDSDKFLAKIFGIDHKLKLDFNNLILMGHSFGGMTAVSVAREDKRVKMLATLDPWLYA
jgi:platelet-activating factor acetylhydrolase